VNSPQSKTPVSIRKKTLFQNMMSLLVVIFLSVTLSSCTAFKASDKLSWGAIPSERGVLALKKAGFKSIINFRTNSNKGRAKYARSLGMNFFNIPTGVFKTPEEAYFVLSSVAKALQGFTAFSFDNSETASHVIPVPKVTKLNRFQHEKSPPLIWTPSRHGGYFELTGRINGLFSEDELSRYGGQMRDGIAVSRKTTRG